MKKRFLTQLLPVFILMLASFFKPAVSDAQTVTANISYQSFYDGLSPYGTWIDYPGYGHVWHPHINGDFRPYLTNGYWSYTSDGWFWESNYDWGWAAFHYGRWIYDDLYGWMWIPGYDWSPAWVTWGSYDDYYAWAPLMPEVYVGVSFGAWRPAAFYWNVCDRAHIYDRQVFNHVVARDVVNVNINRISIVNNFNTTKIHNQYYSRGPQLEEVQKYTNRKIETASLKESRSPARGGHRDNEINVYRPAVEHPQPKEFRRLENDHTNPVRNDNDRINTIREEQQRNIERMPVHNTPQREPGIKRN
jgi:hypothetical protein